MRVEHNHAHAYTIYDLLSAKHYLFLIKSVVECKLNRYKTLTVHLPFEIQHKQVENLPNANRYIFFGELLKKIFKVKLYWENAPWLNVGTWDLKYGNTNWEAIPSNIELCLDTGHLMLGCKNKSEFYKLLNKVLKKSGTQIKYLHLHENNFISDIHVPVPGKVIDRNLIRKIARNRDYIVEKGE